MWKEIRNTLITGLLVILPMALTAIVILWLFNRVDIVFRQPIENIIGFRIYGLGVLITLFLVFAVGLLARNYSGNKLIGFAEWILERIPLVRTIYFSIKQLTETIYGSKHTAFRKAVMVEYPSQGRYSIAFVTSEGWEDLSAQVGEDLLGLFIPTTPNPTSGVYIMMAKKDTIPLEMSVEQAIKLVISGGIVKPDSKK